MATAAKKSATWYALDNLHHDGRAYAPGDAVPSLSDEQAEYLRAAGIVSAVPPVGDALDEGQPQG